MGKSEYAGMDMKELSERLKGIRNIVSNCGSCLDERELMALNAAIWFSENTNNLQMMLYDPENMDKILFDFDHTWCPYNGKILFVEEAQEEGCDNCPFQDTNGTCIPWSDPKSSRKYWERKAADND